MEGNLDISVFVEMFRQFFYKAFEVTLPALVVSLVVVLVVAVLMTVMSIQEQTLTFLPKLFCFVLVIAILGPWMFDQIVTLIGNTWDRIPELL